MSRIFPIIVNFFIRYSVLFIYMYCTLLSTSTVSMHIKLCCTVKKIYEIPGLFLIKSSWECVKSFQRAESYCKFCYVPRKFFPFLRMWNVSFLWAGIFFPVSERLNSLNSWIMTFPGIFLPADTENPYFVVVLVIWPEKPNQTEDCVLAKFVLQDFQDFVIKIWKFVDYVIF